ncbi:hypothetical protein R1sor_002525 [Riccia sorocarpa]|uniref:WRKY domain-containing protein n=1 Tax=Riccia sorocarpa TaxID=122646 RepID=A0ABD3GZW5_9MARC
MESGLEISTVNVLRRDLEDIKDCLIQLSTKQESICSFDVSQPCDRVDGETKCCNSEAKRVFTEKQDQMSFLLKFALKKLDQILPTAAATGQVESSLGLKRSRPLTPLRVCRPAPSFLLDSEALGNTVSGAEGSPPASPGSKFFKVGADSKAPGVIQNNPTLFMPTATVGKVSMDPTGTTSLTTFSVKAEVTSNMDIKSPKKRPSRSRRDRNRQRTKQTEAPVVIQRLKAGEQGKIPDDGYLWRKYGNKPIKTASYKRGYYKCRHFKEMKCNATKIVQQANNDPTVFHVTYKDKHTCKQVQQFANGTGCNLSETDNGSLADQISSQAGAGVDDSLEFEPTGGLEWPASPDNSSASDDLFPQSEEEGVVESVKLEEPRSILDFADDLSRGLTEELSGTELLQQVQESSLDVGSLGSVHVNDWQISTTPDSLKLQSEKLQAKLECSDFVDPMDAENMDEIVLNASQQGSWNFFSDIAFWQPDFDVQTCFLPGN